MTTTTVVWRAVLATALALVFAGLTQAQVQFSAPLSREKICKPGETYVEKIEVINPSEEMDIELWIRQGDLDNSLGSIKFLNPGSVERSNASWIRLPAERILLKKKHKITLPFKIKVPEQIEKGSYFSLVFIQPVIHAEKTEAEAQIGINFRAAYQIVSTVEGGKKELEIEKVTVEGEKLFIDVKNTGTDFMVLKCSLELESLKPLRGRDNFFPGLTVRFEFDLSGVKDGLYKNIRIIFDDGKTFLKAAFITFRKGEEVKETLPLLARLESERLRKRQRGKPYQLYLSLNYGSMQRGLSLNGFVRVWDLSLNAGSYFTEHVYEGIITPYQGYRAILNYNRGFLSMGVGSYLYGDFWQTLLRVGLNFKTTQVAVNYVKESRSFYGSLSQRFFKKYVINGWFVKNPWREQWNVSLQIPIF